MDDSNEAQIAEIDRALEEVASVLVQVRAARKSKVAEQEEELERIQEWFNDSTKPTFVWQLDFAEVFHRHSNSERSFRDASCSNEENGARSRSGRYGFDIVIGNPPYVRLQTLTKTHPENAAFYKDNYSTARKGNYDVYVVFVERGLELLDQTFGQLGYILPHKFFNARYGEPLRALISKGTNLRHVVHFGNQQIFPGATNYVCLLFLASGGTSECRLVRADDLTLWLATQRGTDGRVSAAQITSAEWNFAVGQGAQLFEKLQEVPVKLGDVTERIFQGPITSADGIYLFKQFDTSRNGVTKVHSKELDKTVQIESAVLKRVVRSGSVGRYHANATALVLFPYEVRDNTARLYTRDEMRRDYPFAWDYLSKNRRLLQDRESGSFDDDEWYRFGRTQNLGIWEQPKLLVPYMITELSAYLDRQDNFYFINVTTGGYGITARRSGDLSYLCALLNSTVLDFVLKRVSTTFQGGYFAANKQFIERLPIPLATDGEKTAIEHLVNCLLWLYQQPSVASVDLGRPQDPAVASFFEQVINALVYELFFKHDLRAAGFHFFDLVNDARLPALDSLPSERLARLQSLFELFQKLQSPGSPIRIALDKLQTLDLVRIIEDMA